MKPLLSILLLIPNLIFSQDYLLEFDRFNPVYNFEWSGFEVENAYEVKQDFIEFARQSELLTLERKALSIIEKDLTSELRAVDLNNDKLSDIIYQGPHMGEGSLVHIFMQTKLGFKSVFSTQQGIVKVDWKEELLDKIYIRDWGCCADPNLTSSVYQVDYVEKIPNFVLIWKSVELTSFVTKPKTYFTPKRFEILNEKYKLRANPWIEENTENEFLGIKGNTIGILKKGFLGTAYASVKDKTGRIWWYVLIDNEYELEETYINYSYYESNPYLVGWISSRYMKEIPH